MAKSSIDMEEEVFEINDFTTATDWERFINDFEEVIRQWDLSGGNFKSGKEPLEANELTRGIWLDRVEGIRFSKAHFMVTHCWLSRDEKKVPPQTDPPLMLSIPLHDMMDGTNDFALRPVIARFYGFREFIVISPTGKTEAITTEDNLALLTGSANIALSNTSCQVPVFVQINSKHLNIFQGTMVANDIRSSLDMVYMNDFPQSFCYLTPVLNLFKKKLCGQHECPVPIEVTARFTRILNKWPGDSLFQHHPIDPEDPSGEISRSIDFVAYKDPCLDLRLFSTWNELSEELVTDSQFHSDLDPDQAPSWSVRLTVEDPTKLSSSMSDTLGSFYALSRCPKRSQQILGEMIQEIEATEAEQEVRMALDRLSNPSLNLPQIKLPKRRVLIPQNVVGCLLSLIFEKPENSGPSALPLFYDFRTFKSAPYDCLTWRIVHVLAFVYTSYKDLSTLAIFWKEIINELRRFWESGQSLPGIQEGRPNQVTCLLHQKMQMLNSCIEEKVKWEKQKHQRPSKDQLSSGDDESTSQDGVDEFYDAEENLESSEAVPSSGKVEAEGRLEQYKNECLKYHPQVPLFVPVCQEATPLTDDMLHEQTEIMSQLGTSIEASNLRMRMQLPTLVCDMESFKAANPLASLEDFVRWYSPRDYDEADGGLSQRMKMEGNMWSKTWQEAKAVPVWRQKRLFDFTKEAEKVLHFLASVSLESLVQLFMPILIHSSIAQLHQERDLVLGLNDQELPISYEKVLNPCSALEHCLSLIRRIEARILVVKSLQVKLKLAHEHIMTQTRENKSSATREAFHPSAGNSFSSNSISRGENNTNNFEWEQVKSFVLKLANEPEVSLHDAPRGYFSKLILSLFNMSSDESSFAGSRSGIDTMTSEPGNSLDEKPADPLLGCSAKEFILRVSLPRPTPLSKTLPQRFHCLMTKKEFRVAGVFSEDTS